jgi:hypothetical protein
MPRTMAALNFGSSAVATVSACATMENTDHIIITVSLLQSLNIFGIENLTQATYVRGIKRQIMYTQVYENLLTGDSCVNPQIKVY